MTYFCGRLTFFIGHTLPIKTIIVKKNVAVYGNLPYFLFGLIVEWLNGLMVECRVSHIEASKSLQL